MGVPWAMEHPKVWFKGAAFFLGNGFTSWKTITLGKIMDNPSPYFFKIKQRKAWGPHLRNLVSC